jgi:sulfite reductase (NADPH) flavoprotein alpha-component
MSLTPAIHALLPLSEEKSSLLTSLLDGLDTAALHWLSGYAAGLAVRRPAELHVLPTPILAAQNAPTLSIVYGSQTGNSRHLAEQLKREAEASGLGVRLLRAGEYPLRELKSERLLYLIISTQGDGDPPDDARGLVEYLLSKRAPELKQLNFAVLALGDSSYPKFCESGRLLDERLAALGATRTLPRVDCDLDFERDGKPWLIRALNSAREQLKPAAAVANIKTLRSVTGTALFGRDNPFQAEVLASQRITGRDAQKDVRHIELSLADSGLSYSPGDALGVWPQNPPQLVNELLQTLNLDGASEVEFEGRRLPLSRWLGSEREITRLARPFLASHAAHSGSNELNRLLAPASREELAPLLRNYQVIDVLREWPATWSSEELVASLRRLTPRLYSIASSQKLVGDEVHLTLGTIDYQAFGSRHIGAASNFLATLDDDGRAPVYVEANERFRLPADASRDILMIGPGTGIAPFRAFVQERTATNASGRNWLFFGEQYFASQFLYQLEWQEALKKGQLHRLDLAFSRDQAQKIYVQQRLREQGRAVWDWLDNGAHLYVCGDATRMAPDVHAVLREIVIEHGDKSSEDADDYLVRLAQQNRYARDVY